MSGSGKDRYVPVTGTIEQVTEKAVLFNVDDAEEKTWVPRSVLEDDTGLVKLVGAEIELMIERWFADREGWN